MSYARTHRRERTLRLGGVVLSSTLGLTMAFFGIVALVTGNAGGALGRLPLYVLGMAATFVGALVVLEELHAEAGTILVAAAVLSAANFLLLSLAAEGLVFALRHPSAVVSSHQFVYVLSAGMIATGLGFWLARHRGEVGLGDAHRL